MIANKDEYLRAYTDFASHWNAKELLKHLESINKDFYPVPLIVESINDTGVKNLDYVKKGFLTQSQFVTLYNKCGGLMHTKNPFSSKSSPILNNSDAKKWISLIQKLLSFHRARMIGKTEGWIIDMNHMTDGHVHGFQFEAPKNV